MKFFLRIFLKQILLGLKTTNLAFVMRCLPSAVRYSPKKWYSKTKISEILGKIKILKFQNYFSAKTFIFGSHDCFPSSTWSKNFISECFQQCWYSWAPFFKFDFSRFSSNLRFWFFFKIRIFGMTLCFLSAIKTHKSRQIRGFQTE